MLRLLTYTKPHREVEYGNEAEEIRGLKEIIRKKDLEIEELKLESEMAQRCLLDAEYLAEKMREKLIELSPSN